MNVQTTSRSTSCGRFVSLLLRLSPEGGSDLHGLTYLSPQELLSLAITHTLNSLLI
jgi:hypothetical protein